MSSCAQVTWRSGETQV